MEKFNAGRFHEISKTLGQLAALTFGASEDNLDSKLSTGGVEIAIQKISTAKLLCGEIGLTQSALSCERMADMLAEETRSVIIQSRIDELCSLIASEMSFHLFLWVPAHRAQFYNKTAGDLLGEHATIFFPSVSKDAEESVKCYSVGRFTACAFHLMRVTEAAVRAFGIAIGFKAGNNPNWGKIFERYDAQLAMPPNNRPKPWDAEGEFLKAVGGDLRAVKSAWRNPTMHLDKSYDEEDATKLLVVIPALMRNLSKKIDKDGIFY